MSAESDIIYDAVWLLLLSFGFIVEGFESQNIICKQTEIFAGIFPISFCAVKFRGENVSMGPPHAVMASIHASVKYRLKNKFIIVMHIAPATHKGNIRFISCGYASLSGLI